MTDPHPGDETLIAGPGHPRRITGTAETNNEDVMRLLGPVTGDRPAPRVEAPPLPWWRRWWRRVVRADA